MTAEDDPGPPLGHDREIQVGDVLNHVFEVRRFISRGSTGDRFEGINLDTGERVAITVMLPASTADPAMQSTFRKEARTLSRLSHPALVQYRILAQEPRSGALYIVTEYIDGESLSERLGQFDATAPLLSGLLTRLAKGLRAAHAQGAIHWNISPGSIMLGDGRLVNARVVDFGIGRDGDQVGPDTAYLAPEQLGDGDDDVGPWTDVYSLALTIVAAARGADVEAGATRAKTLALRRAGVSLDGVPTALHPVLEAMLVADPAHRLRSMDDVLGMLDRSGLCCADDFPPQSASGGAGSRPGAASSRMRAGLKLLATAAGAAVLVGLLAYAGWHESARQSEPRPVPEPSPVPVRKHPPTSTGNTVIPPSDPVATARDVLEAKLAATPCSWLEIGVVEQRPGGTTIVLRGASGQQSESLDMLDGALRQAGITQSTIEFDDVSPVPVSFCRAMESLNRIRAAEPGRLSMRQREYELRKLPPREPGKPERFRAEAVFTINLKDFSDDLTLIGLSESGEMQQLPINEEVIRNTFRAVGRDTYRFPVNINRPGWSGMLMLSGKGPFEGELLTHAGGAPSGEWAGQFDKAAGERQWRADMIWYRATAKPTGK